MPLFDTTTWPFSVDLLPIDAYLVGGSVRDRLLNRKPSYLDLDFVLPADTLKISSQIARQHKAGYVVLAEKRQIARVTFENMTVDFAQRQGDSTAADLGKRDFTVNAIAYNPHTHTLIDPINGQADLAARILRMVSQKNLAADPIRLLRGFRQSAQLGFELEADTQAAIKELAPRLVLVAPERVRNELDALLSTSAGTPQFAHILSSDLLSIYLRKFNQQSVDNLVAIDRAYQQIKQHIPSLAQQVLGWVKPTPVGCYRSWMKVTKLSQLLPANPKDAEYELVEGLRYSRYESDMTLRLVKAQNQINEIKSGNKAKESERSQQFFLFKLLGESFPAFALLAIARGVDIATVQFLNAKFQNPNDPVAHPPTLISGDILIKQLGIKPGPDLGGLLSAVEQAQARGDVQSAEDAIAYVRTIL